MHWVKNDANIHISTYPFSYLSDVEHHNHLLLGHSVSTGNPHEIIPFLVSQRVPADDPHGLVHAPPISNETMNLILFVTTQL
jgi:hypothetical protein